MTDEQRTLSDEDISTHLSGTAAGSGPVLQRDGDGADGDAQDSTDGDAQDSTDGDAQDSTDGDAGDADSTDAADADGQDA